MKRLLLTMLCAAGLLAQESVSRVLQLKHIHPDSVSAVLNVLSANKVRWQADGNLRIIAMNGPAELVEGMEAAIKKLDVPTPSARNIELTFHMLLAAPQGESGVIQAELAGVAQQLRNVFGLRAVRVLETAVVRAREGKLIETSGVMAAPTKVEANALYSIKVRSVGISATDKGSSIRLDGLRFDARLPAPGTQNQYSNAEISTDIDIREGQKVVVGKTSIDTASQSIFLVVTAKVVD